MPVDVTDKFIRIRIKDPGLFVADSFRTITLSEKDGIQAIIGKLKTNPSGNTEVQAYLFDKNKWTVERAKKWVEDNKKANNNMETKAFSLKEITDKGIGRAVIATLDVIDKDKDIAVAGAFGTQHVKLLPAHDRMSVPLGKAVLKEEGNSVIADFAFNLSIQKAVDWYNALRFDMDNGVPIQEWSYGFVPTLYELGDKDGQSVRFLKAVEVFEISPVLRGAGAGTRTLALKEEGERYIDQAERTLAEVEALVGRSEELASLRAKDGRNLSTDNQQRLQTLYTSLAEIQGELKLLLESGDKQDASKLLAAFQKIQFGNRHLLTL
mgnify:CR=1 FL=1